MANEKMFTSIRETARITGISEHFIRKGVRNNTIPYIMSGKKYMVNLSRFIELVEEESSRAMVSSESDCTTSPDSLRVGGE